MIISAVALYAVRGVVHKMRAQNRRASFVQKHLWEQVRVAARYSGSLTKKLESLWNNTKATARAKAHSHPTRDRSRPAADAEDVYSWWRA